MDEVGRERPWSGRPHGRELGRCMGSDLFHKMSVRGGARGPSEHCCYRDDRSLHCTEGDVLTRQCASLAARLSRRTG